MKRIKAACLCQTLHFMIKEDIEQDYAVKMVKDEVDRYKARLIIRRPGTELTRKQLSRMVPLSSKSSSSITATMLATI
jgi:hypothetical protein